MKKKRNGDMIEQINEREQLVAIFCLMQETIFVSTYFTQSNGNDYISETNFVTCCSNQTKGNVNSYFNPFASLQNLIPNTPLI